MNPPHSAMHGMPSAILVRISSNMEVLDSSSSPWSSGYPPERTIPSTSGSFRSLMGENLTISAPMRSRISMLSSYVKQNASSSANPMRTLPSMRPTSGAE